MSLRQSLTLLLRAIRKHKSSAASSYESKKLSAAAGRRGLRPDPDDRRRIPAYRLLHDGRQRLDHAKSELNLAVADEGAIPMNIAQRFSCSVSSDGKFYVMKEEVSLEELGQRLGAMRQEQPQVKVVLRADRLTEHQYVNDILSECAKNGVNNVIFATYQSAL